MSYEDKDRQRQRHRRGIKREIEHREARREKKRRAREDPEEPKSARGHRLAWDEDAPAMEKIRRPRKPRGPRVDSLPDPILDDPQCVPRAGDRRGLVVGVHRDALQVRDEAGVVARIPRTGRERDAVVGDQVQLSAGGIDSPPQVRFVEPRQSVLGRPDPQNPRNFRAIAANIDRGLIVLAAPPHGRLRTGLIDRAGLALEAGGVQGIVVVNKIDRLEPGAEVALDAALVPYRDAGLPCALVSAERGEGLQTLQSWVSGLSVVLLGPSGVGKSSLTNALRGFDGSRTGAVRAADDKGRHTTTHSELVFLDDGTRVIDTPGIRAFAALSVDLDTLRAAFPDIEQESLACRFADCRHDSEPGCAVRDAVAPQRLDRWRRLRAEIEAP